MEINEIYLKGYRKGLIDGYSLAHKALAKAMVIIEEEIRYNKDIIKPSGKGEENDK